MSWFEVYDGVFFITIITILSGSFALMLKYCLKSKCDNVSCCWGGVIIHRNTDLEEEALEINERTNEGKNNIL